MVHKIIVWSIEKTSHEIIVGSTDKISHERIVWSTEKMFHEMIVGSTEKISHEISVEANRENFPRDNRLSDTEKQPLNSLIVFVYSSPHFEEIEKSLWSFKYPFYIIHVDI